MKKYSEVIPQKINESAVLGKQVFPGNGISEDDFKAWIKTLAIMFPVIPDYSEGMELFKKEDMLFLKVPGKGLVQMAFSIETK